jgi:hypothetical protein
MTVGFLAVGGSFAVLLPIGNALLKQGRSDAALVLIVLLANIFGFGVATPTELVVARRYNIGAADAAKNPVRWLFAVSAVGAVGAWVLGAESFPGVPAAGPCAALTILGWAGLVAARSRLAGVGDLTLYSGVLLTEAISRLALVAAAVAFRSSAELLLFLSASIPLVLATAAAASVKANPTARPEAPEETAPVEQLAFIGVSLGYQACLSAAGLLLSVRLHHSDLGNAQTYFRAPTVAMGGITTHTLVSMSHAWGEADLPRFRQAMRTGVRNTAIVITALTAGITLVAPVVLPILYQPHLHLPWPVLGALAGSSVIAAVGSVSSLSLLAAGRGARASAAWLIGAAVTVGAFTVSSGTDATAVVGLLLGPAIALVLIVLAVRQLLHKGAAASPLFADDPILEGR